MTQPRVLIVDDDAVVADALGELVRAEGFEALRVADGEAALRALLKEEPGRPPIGIVLVDLLMPGIDGMRLLQLLRDKHPDVAAVVVTGYGKIASAVQAVKLGAVDYLTKPVVLEDLRAALQTAYHRHTLLATAPTEDEQPADPDPPRRPDPEPVEAWVPMTLDQAMQSPERRILRAALEANDWHRTRTAEQLGIDRTTLYKKIRKHRLDEPDRHLAAA